MDVTITFAQKPKKRNVKCAVLPHRTFTISANVCADGATFLRLIAITPNKST